MSIDVKLENIGDKHAQPVAILPAIRDKIVGLNMVVSNWRELFPTIVSLATLSRVDLGFVRQGTRTSAKEVVFCGQYNYL